MENPLVTILVPHYKTAELTKLCLRLLRKHTPAHLIHCIVIDNDSQDESTDYLRTVSWIELIERKPLPGERPLQGHGRALDRGLERVKTPYVLSIHTDTLVKHPDWLMFLLSHINPIQHNNQDNTIAGVGSWKLETKPWYRQLFKNIERKIQLFYYKLINKQNHSIEGKGKNYFYLRSHCALYKTDLLKEYHLKFDDEDTDAGKVMHRKLVEKNHEMIFIPSHNLNKYIDHIDHATMVLNPALGASKKTIKRGLHKIKARLQSVDMDNMLKQDCWDK